MAAAGLTPKYLRCEYLVDPLGIDETEPRLSWIVGSHLRGADLAVERSQKQTAYRLVVASSEDALTRDEGDLWDSGKVASDETAHVVYAGKPLRSRARCFWKVRVWDGDGAPSTWSQSALWTMGLLEPGDGSTEPAEVWKAVWIGYDEALTAGAGRAELPGAKWIWSAGGGNPATGAPAGKVYLRARLTLPEGARVERAPFVMTADDQFRLFVNGEPAGKSDGGTDAWRRPRTLEVAKHLRPGANLIAVEAENTAASPAGLVGRLVVTLAGTLVGTLAEGGPVVLATGAGWKCTDKAPDASPGGDDWTSPDFDDDAWPAARELGPFGCGPWGRISSSGHLLPPPRYCRKEFQAAKEIRRATAYASALGIYELHLNGRRVGEDYFTPGWTDYNRRVYYNTYEVTDLVREGGNALGAVLADGWYAGYVGYGGRREHYGKSIRLLVQLHLEYADGSSEVIATDETWKASTGPLLEADFLMGEAYDATKEIAGWDEPGFDDAGWGDVDVTPQVRAKVEAYPGVTVKRFEDITPVSLKEPKPGAYVFDLGQNIAGFARLKVSAPRGTRITLRFAERLNPDGTVYTTNLRRARATDTYVCRGDGEEVWEPRFTFHGFQYVELTGLDRNPPAGGKPSRDAVTGVSITSATPPAGSFECSDETANILYRNICRTQRANFIDVPTDCPQRDERLGWTGDAQVYIRTAAYNTDVAAFFTKWLVDLDDAQRGDGQYPCVAPLKVAGSDGGPAWADAGVICPWTIYEVYGDERVIERHYEGMAKFIAFCRRHSPGLLPPKSFHCFGDWLSIGADTPKEVIYTAYFARSTKLMARAAEALGRDGDAARYNRLFDDICEAFRGAYVEADGKIRGDTQAVYVMALAYGLLDADGRRRAAERLVEKIEQKGWRLSTGFVGTKDLMMALEAIGRTDVAYRLFHNDTFPSWGFSIRHGATSIWERWDGWTPDGGFQTPGMNSFAHYAFGAVGEWMMKTIAGIDTEGPGFRRIVIRPLPGGRLTWARTRYESIRGRIETDWRLEGGRLALKVVVPANVTATVHVPASDPPDVTEGGRPAGRAESVRFLRIDEGAAVYEVGSGVYEFVSEGVEGVPPVK